MTRSRTSRNVPEQMKPWLKESSERRNMKMMSEMFRRATSGRSCR